MLMSGNITDTEWRPASRDKDGDDLVRRLTRLNLAQIASGRQALILIEGVAGTAKTDALRAIVAALDPLHFDVHHRGARAGAMHWLAPYWRQLPDSGQTSIVFRGWYSAAAGDRQAGLADRDWARRCDEINEFEAQQTDHGLILAKLIFRARASVRVARLADRATDGGATPHELPAREADEAIWEEMLDRCGTRWAPFSPIDAELSSAATRSALAAIADRLERALGGSA